MLNIKLSLPGVSAIDWGQFLGPNRTFDDLPFALHVNSQVDNPDYWFVIEGFEPDDNFARIDRSRIFFLGAEAGHPADFWLRDTAQVGYLSQFGGTRGHLARYEVGAEVSTPFLPWMLFANHGESTWSPKSSAEIEYIWGDTAPEKSSRKIAMFCSNQQWNAYHKRRYDFASKLTQVFPNEIAWFGNGVNPVDTKFEGLYPYTHSLVLENGTGANLITEKLLDSFLAWTFPVYSGASNVDSYFPGDAIAKFDIEDFSGACKLIEAILDDENHWERHLDDLREARGIVRSDFNILDRLGKLAMQLEQLKLPNNRELIELSAIQSFEPRGTIPYRLALRAYRLFFRQSAS